MKRKIGLVAALPLLISTSTWAAAPSDPIYKSLRDAPVETTFPVENLVLHRDAGTITLKSGRLGLTARTLERDTVAVFEGEGEFSLSPAQPGERAYLKGLTQAESVKEIFDRAMFAFTDDTGKEIRGQLKAGAADPKLNDILHDFRSHLRNLDTENITAELLTDLYQPGFKGFFSAYFHGRQHGDLRFHVRPRGASLSLGPEEVMVINVQPAGVPDEVWYLSHLANELSLGLNNSGEDHRRVRATSYKIETTIAKNDHFTATTELAYDALATGDRVLHLGLIPTLRVSNVVSDGKEVAFIQEDRKLDGAFYVVLESPLKAGSEHHLVITYEGDKVVHKAGGGNFSVGARQSWYPNLNSFHDYARYDLTFRVPKQYTLVSVGKLEKEWQEEGQSCTHWQSEIPLVVAGFNYGIFKKKGIADKTTGFAIEGYANSEMPDYLKEITVRNETVGLESMGATTGMTPSLGTMSPSSLMNGTMTEAQNAVRIYSAWFGKPTYSRLALTQQPDFDFGQSWPTLVYLPMSAYLDSTQRWMLVGINKGLSEFVEEVTPHEVAHQWWGHTVSDATYHDAWLSEGFAEFSAGIYLQMTQKPDRVNRFWADARKRILEKNKFGHAPNDAGPISMGFRLNTEKNFAYSTVIYEKGAFVLHMLQQMMYDKNEGDKPFIAMMHEFVEQYRNRNATTEDFQKVAEKYVTPHTDLAGNRKLDWFFSEWVYGTTIPKYTVDYTVTPDSSGKFIVKGTLTQSEVPADFGMIVPIYLEFDNGMARLGTASMSGNHTTPFQVVVPKKPKRVLVNAYNEVLAQ